MQDLKRSEFDAFFLVDCPLKHITDLFLDFHGKAIKKKKEWSDQNCPN